MGKKQDIIDAAYRIFQRHGYRRTNVEDIAKAVGIRKSGLYYYFESKEDIFVQTFSGEWVEKLTAFCEKMQQEPDIRKRILVFAKGNFREVAAVVNKFGGTVETIIENRNYFGKDIHCQLNDIQADFYQKAIEEGIQHGIFRAIDSQRAARTILGVNNALEFTSLSLMADTLPTDQDFKKIEQHILLSLGLILDGLSCKEGLTSI